MKPYQHLFSAGNINPQPLKNPVILPPMGTFLNYLSGETPEKRIELFPRRARGGAAMPISKPLFTEDLHLMGDARKPRKIMHAVSEGFYTAYHL